MGNQCLDDVRSIFLEMLKNDDDDDCSQKADITSGGRRVNVKKTTLDSFIFKGAMIGAMGGKMRQITINKI